jgi:hypothetical protein
MAKRSGPERRRRRRKDRPPLPRPSREEMAFLADTLRHCLRIIERMCGR